MIACGSHNFSNIWEQKQYPVDHGDEERGNTGEWWSASEAGVSVRCSLLSMAMFYPYPFACLNTYLTWKPVMKNVSKNSAQSMTPSPSLSNLAIRPASCWGLSLILNTLHVPEVNAQGQRIHNHGSGSDSIFLVLEYCRSHVIRGVLSILAHS